MFFKKLKIALALGGGAARGLCNIGVLKVLCDYYAGKKFPFDMVIGSSMGSLVGASFCSGKKPEEIQKLALTFDWPNLVDFGLSPTGILRGDKLEKIIVEMMGDISFEKMKIPFALTTIDIQTGEGFLHTSGDIIKLLRASCSWPGFFSSIEYEGKLLADGGVRNSVPTKYAYGLGATFVVAIDPGFAVSSQRIDNAFKALLQSIQIMGEELNMYQSDVANVVIRPDLKEVNQFDFDKAEYIINQGEAAAREIARKMDSEIKMHVFYRKGMLRKRKQNRGKF
ncbi:MAG: patatin-like phospholipase family protein [Candidatus Omnitrophica bacterium]|nr:patatin-like phospholipase family protein [Candidatus Omnitrophota bacterium]